MITQRWNDTRWDKGGAGPKLVEGATVRRLHLPGVWYPRKL